MKLMEDSKEEMGSLDNISKLPEFILSHILSFLDTKEACRASIVSKQWGKAWASMPVLDFRPEYVEKACLPALKYNREFYDHEMVDSYERFIDTTMQRYSKEQYLIKKFKLEFPRNDIIFGISIDKWVKIAVNYHIEEFNLDILLSEILMYRLPEIVFSAVHLKKLVCRNVMLPYYVTNKLNRLVSLRLSHTIINEPLLQQILASCPLIDLHLDQCYGLQKVWIPWVKNSINSSHRDDNGSTLEQIYYHGLASSLWPCEINVSVLRKLRSLEIVKAAVTDDIVSVLVSELPSLEVLKLSLCSKLKNFEVSSNMLKKFEILSCHQLETVKITAPNLVEYRYTGAPRPSLFLMNAQVHCYPVFKFQAQQHPTMEMFRGIQEFLLRSNIFKVMMMNLASCHSEVADVEEDFLQNISFGSCYTLEQVKLLNTCQWNATSSSLPAFLDCLFWSCRPDALIMHTTLSFQNNTMKYLLETLKDKVKSWKHPLKRIEVEWVDSSLLISDSIMEIKIRLYW